VELVTSDRFLTNEDNFKLSISYPGSYEVSGFSINGFSALAKEGGSSVIYSVNIDGVKIGVVGEVDKELSDDQLESLGVLDILIVPVGGGDSLDATGAAMTVRKSDANVIIPINYADADINYSTEHTGLDLFLKESGLEVEKVAKYKIKSASAIPEKPTVVVLDRR
jgi:L-ascorbate metabolism protein UlaG (beta-lactamase superfamily)